ncbi:MAG: protein-methionine-sulfoxide reductase heme-binding subunit MsrQ [Pseudomonadales bacterium]
MKSAKPFIFLLCLVPCVWLIYQAITGQLSPDAGKELVLGTGEWAIRFLLLALTITPLRQWTGKTALLRYRRMIGLYAWFYASLHLLSVLTYLLGWSWAIFVEEFVERPYMALGILAWVLMVPLGLTSNRWAQRKLGRRWKTLQSLVYVIAILACAHFVWLLRSDFGEALSYSLILLFLLSARVFSKYRRSTPLAGVQSA